MLATIGMKEFLKDYGTLIGPLFAFALGSVAIMIKFYLDRKLDYWTTNKKIKKLVSLIKYVKPPAKYLIPERRIKIPV